MTLRYALRLVLPAALIVLWQLLVRSGTLPPSASAAPTDVAATLSGLLVSGPLLRHTSFSVLRLISGVASGAALAVLVCLLITLSRTATTMLLPTLQVAAGVPVVLWMPFCVMLFGTGEVFKISLTSIATFFLVQLFVLNSLHATERRFVEVARLYETPISATVRHVFWPASLPALFSSVRAALAAGWVILFFVEFAASEEGKGGLGWFIADSRHTGRIEEEFAGLVWLAIIAFAFDRALARWQVARLAWVDAFSSTSA